MSRSSVRSTSTCGAFPIPMRGNERGRVATVSVDGWEFPIPMRGNERLWARTPTMSEANVSDPHEG